MRTVPSYAKQTEIWAELLEELGFKHVIFIHSSDQEGRAMLGKFQSKTESDSKKVGSTASCNDLCARECIKTVS
jgi:ABC-type branched-subunit amino acid transport system substrate-binding protein